jgi:predicted RNA-binding Zn ribbon-like protein
MLSVMAVARWSWLGEPLAIDVANTVRRRGLRYIEHVRSPEDLREWLEHERDRLAVPDRVDADLVSRFLVVRDHVLSVLRAAARSGAGLPADDVAAINDAALAAPAIRLLRVEPGRYFTRPVIRTDQVTRFLADIAAAAIDLLTGPEAAALTLCDAPGCGQLYLRGRPNQQWCDPHCGMRARSQRYAERPLRATRWVSAEGRAEDRCGVRIDVRRELQDLAGGGEHQLPGLNHDDLSVGVPEVPEDPHLLVLAVRRGEAREVVGLGQREIGVEVRV